VLRLRTALDVDFCFSVEALLKKSVSPDILSSEGLSPTDSLPLQNLSRDPFGSVNHLSHSQCRLFVSENS
jgi:hypothetical protein